MDENEGERISGGIQRFRVDSLEVWRALFPCLCGCIDVNRKSENIMGENQMH